MAKEIPNAVRTLYDKLFTIDYVGKYNNADVYNIYMKNRKTGLPIICLYYSNGKTEEINGFEALDIINTLIKE